MESLNTDFFLLSTKINKTFVLSNWLGICLYMEIFQRFSSNSVNFLWPFSVEVEINLIFCISRDHMINESRDSGDEIPST